MEAFLKGLGVGFGMIVFLGPVFFTLIHATLSKGRNAGFFVALGVFVSDIVIVLACIYLLNKFSADIFKGDVFILSSFVILLGFGLKYLFFSAQPKIEVNTRKLSFDNTTNFLAGFSVNFLNPFVFAVWMGVVGYTKNMKYSDLEVSYFFIACLVAIIITDISKVFLADKISEYIKPDKLTMVYKFFGVLMIGFAVRVLFYWYSQG